MTIIIGRRGETDGASGHNQGGRSSLLSLAGSPSVLYNLPMPRHARLDAPGTLYHVMARGIDQTNIFVDDADRAKFLGILEELVFKTGTKIPAWSWEMC